jgi:hypothetical protein
MLRKDGDFVIVVGNEVAFLWLVVWYSARPPLRKAHASKEAPFSRLLLSATSFNEDRSIPCQYCSRIGKEMILGHT